MLVAQLVGERSQGEARLRPRLASTLEPGVLPQSVGTLPGSPTSGPSNPDSVNASRCPAAWHASCAQSSAVEKAELDFPTWPHGSRKTEDKP